MSGAGVAPEPFDLARRHDAAVALVAVGADTALTVPAAQRVDADPERLRRFAHAVILPRHVYTVPMQGLARNSNQHRAATSLLRQPSAAATRVPERGRRARTARASGRI